jgi:hypothetical protein
MSFVNGFMTYDTVDGWYIPYKPKDMVPGYWNDIDPYWNRPMCYS